MDKDQQLIFEAYQLLGEGLDVDAVLDAVLKAWSAFTTKKGGGFDDGGERPIPLADKETRDVAHYNANLPPAAGGGYSDEEKAKNQSELAASTKEMDRLLADFYPILDIILDGTNNNKEVWFQVLQMIEQTEISQMEKHMIRRGMNKVWHDQNDLSGLEDV